MVIGAGLNIILDAVFIISLKMGVRGAALATVIAQLASTIFYLHYFFSGRSYLKIRARNMIIDWSIVKSIMAIGISAFAMSVGQSLSGILCNRIFLAYGGDLAISTWGILSRLMMFAVMPGSVISQGLQPILGFNYGAKRGNLVFKSIKIATLVATGFHIISFIVIYSLPQALIGIFTTDSELIQLSADASRIVFVAIVFMGYYYVSQTVFVATGKAVQAFFSSISRQTLFLIPSVFILPYFWQLNGMWMAFPVSDGLACLLVTVLLIPQLMRFRRDLPA
jgi:Na+-driven multidrug efflux pump